MDPFDDFDRRLAEVHGLPNASQRDGTMSSHPNIEQSELRAMIDSFLGEGYDAVKVAELERVQAEMRSTHARLAASYQRGEIGPIEYVAQFNTAAYESFGRMQTILGKADFAKLFGPPPDRSLGFIDKQAFLRGHQERSASGSSLRSVPP